MTTVAAALPLLGLRITAGPVELRGVTDDLIVPLADLASAGIHDPDFMPFYGPWSLTPPEEMTRCVGQFHWGRRAGFSVADWGPTSRSSTTASSSGRRASPRRTI
jgi:hypothetical protein